MDPIPNIVIPSNPGATTCGYCSPSGQRSRHATSYHAATLEAIKLTCGVYQQMIDRGWRRSGEPSTLALCSDSRSQEDIYDFEGTYCYKPDLKGSCCPQYTIKLDATAFTPSRSQRKLINRWNRFVLQGSSGDEMDVTGPGIPHAPYPKKGPPCLSLSHTIHSSEFSFQENTKLAHVFETVLEPSSYTAEKFALYKKYQIDIHNDKGSTASGFKRFLVESPLTPESIPYTSSPPSHLPRNYGSYHQLYRLDGELIAMAVLDILPNCVSSVYFMYDKGWERFSLGKLSALREASLAQEIRDAGVVDMGYLYMGFYIYSCPKMRYKGDYSPSYLADPETYDWYPLVSCIPLLEKNRYACFSTPSHSADDRKTGPTNISADQERDFDDINIITRSESGDLVSIPIQETRHISVPQVELAICIRGLSKSVAKGVTFAV